MEPSLRDPSPAVAERLLGEVSFAQRLTGVKFAKMGGANPTSLYSLRAAASFLKVDSYEQLTGDGGNATVGYIEGHALALWISEVLGDEDLASRVRAVADETEFYGQAVQPMRALLETRLAQADNVVHQRTNESADASPEGQAVSEGVRA